MSKILKVSQNNYRVQVVSGGAITLDTGDAVGTVVITGNLDVKGNTTTVESTNTTVKDNIIQINYGQTGDGISAALNYQAGIQIGRGNYSDAKMVFDETVTHYDQATDSNLPGTFSFQFADGTLAGIQASGIAAGAGSNLNLDMQGQPVVVEIANADALSYSARVTAADGNAVPNKQFLIDYIQAGLVVSGQADVDRIYKGHGLPTIIDTEVLANTANIQFFVRSISGLEQRAVITANGLNVDDVNLYGHTITSSGVSNLILTAASSNEVQVDSVLDLTDQVNPVAATPNMTKIYSRATAGPGNTNLFFTNGTAVEEELVSKSRAVLLSILL